MGNTKMKVSIQFKEFKDFFRKNRLLSRLIIRVYEMKIHAKTQRRKKFAKKQVINRFDLQSIKNLFEKATGVINVRSVSFGKNSGQVVRRSNLYGLMMGDCE